MGRDSRKFSGPRGLYFNDGEVPPAAPGWTTGEHARASGRFFAACRFPRRPQGTCPGQPHFRARRRQARLDAAPPHVSGRAARARILGIGLKTQQTTLNKNHNLESNCGDAPPRAGVPRSFPSAVCCRGGIVWRGGQCGKKRVVSRSAGRTRESIAHHTETTRPLFFTSTAPRTQTTKHAGMPVPPQVTFSNHQAQLIPKSACSTAADDHTRTLQRRRMVSA